MSTFDYTAVREAIRTHREKLFSKLRIELSQDLKSMSPKEALTLRLMREGTEVSRIVPTVKGKEFAYALYSFCREKEYKGLKVDSAVTPRVIAVVERSILEFFNSTAVAEAVAAAVINEVRSAAAGTSSIRSEILGNKDWLSHELNTLANISVAHSIAGQLVDITAQQINEFFHSAAGKQLMVVVGKVMATSGGKVALLKLLNVAIANVMASAALRSAILAAIKKVGIGVLIKTAVGKALIALLALVGIAHVPVAWLVLPIIAGFLGWEYLTFPDKLAAKIPSEVVRIVDSKFGELSDTVARRVSVAIWEDLVEELTKIRFDRPPAA